MIYGKLSDKNFEGITDGIGQFCSVPGVKVLGYRVSAVLRVCCGARGGQIHDIDVSIYTGNRLHSGRFASVIKDATSRTAIIGMSGRRVGLGTKEMARMRRLPVKTDDFIGFARDDSLLMLYDKEDAKLDFIIKLRLRDIYALRLNNITERVTNCLARADDSIPRELCSKWGWTRKLICLAALECLLRATGLWDNKAVRDECRNEAVIKLMVGDLILDGIEGLDEYNMYSNDAEQRVRDSELLVTCGRWLAGGGSEVASGLRAGDLSESALSGWKAILESELGVVLPPLNKQGSISRVVRTSSAFGLGGDVEKHKPQRERYSFMQCAGA
jgi:hypothetical protein